MSRTNWNNSVAEIEDTAASWVFRRAGGLSLEEQAAFERWRAGDPRHAAALARHERAWSTLDRPRQAGQADFLLAKLAQRASRRRRRRAGIVSAACALLIAGTTWWNTRESFPAAPERQALVVLPETQRLDDGSIVEMKFGAAIAIDFSGAFRRVVLKQGEAHFQVAHESRPFVVTAGDIEFRAVGTAFSVQIAAAQVELLVTEGRVAVVSEVGGQRSEVSTGNDDDPSEVAGLPTSDIRPLISVLRPRSPELIVDAGKRIVLASASEAGAMYLPPTLISREEMEERLAWRAAKLEFTETPLAEAVALMNQHNRVKLVIADAELGKLLVSGLFRVDRTEAFVRLLEANFDVRAEQTGPTTYLYRKR